MVQSAEKLKWEDLLLVTKAATTQCSRIKRDECLQLKVWSLHYQITRVTWQIWRYKVFEEYFLFLLQWFHHCLHEQKHRNDNASGIENLFCAWNVRMACEHLAYIFDSTLPTASLKSCACTGLCQALKFASQTVFPLHALQKLNMELLHHFHEGQEIFFFWDHKQLKKILSDDHILSCSFIWQYRKHFWKETVKRLILLSPLTIIYFGSENPSFKIFNYGLTNLYSKSKFLWLYAF